MKPSILNPFTWFRVIRHLAMLGPEARRLNRNIEAVMRHFQITIPATDAQLREATDSKSPDLQSFQFNEHAAYIEQVREKLSRGETVSDADILAAAEMHVRMEEEKFNNED